MTAYRFVTLTCDVCGNIFDDGQSTAVRQARLRAKDTASWRIYDHGSKDMCGQCVADPDRVRSMTAALEPAADEDPDR